MLNVHRIIMIQNWGQKIGQVSLHSVHYFQHQKNFFLRNGFIAVQLNRNYSKIYKNNFHRILFDGRLLFPANQFKKLVKMRSQFRFGWYKFRYRFAGAVKIFKKVAQCNKVAVETEKQKENKKPTKIPIKRLVSK